MKQGNLIIFEGADGVGKSTLAHKLVEYLISINIPCKYLSFPGREAGTLGYHVYQLHHHSSQFGVDKIPPMSLQLLHIAAHVDAIENNILPLLEKGYYVVLDRFWWSTWVYGIVGGVNQLSLHKMIELETLSWDKTIPNIAYLINRSLPLRDEKPTDHWKQLCTTYHELVATQRHKHPIEVIDNDASIDISLNNIIKSLTSIKGQ